MNISHRTAGCFVIASIVLSIFSFGSVRGASDDVLAEIGDVKIIRADLDAKLEEIPTYARSNFETREGMLKLVDRMVRTELLMQAAVSENYQNRPDIRAKIDDATRRIITSEFFKTEMGAPPEPPEADIIKYYDAHKDEYQTKASAEISHILVETEKEALKVKTELADSELTFEAAVAKYSTDRETAGRDQMGTVREDGFIKGIGRSGAFEDIVFKLNPGDISDPVKSRKGWHILRVDSRTDAGFIPIEDVRKQIMDELLVTDADIEKEYQANPDNYKTRARCKIKHILTASEEDGKSVYDSLQNGDQFSELV